MPVLPEASIKVVQFPHPGGEHTARSGTGWYTRSGSNTHRRKYMVMPGRYVTETLGTPQHDEVYFWGEWESQSELLHKYPHVPEGHPRHLFRPWYALPHKFDAEYNTDPFVFGPRMHYCICKQRSYLSLKLLSPGSIVLFGSRMQGFGFVLDTLFVVHSMQPYHMQSYGRLKGEVSPVYFDCGLRPLFMEADDGKIRINGRAADEDKTGIGHYCSYNGVHYQERGQFGGMFSFVPCLPGTDGKAGFARPAITLPGYITETLSQGLRYEIVAMDQAAEVWQEVAAQVMAQGLQLMVETDAPPQLALGE